MSQLPLPVRKILRDPASEASIDAAWQRHQLARPRAVSRFVPIGGSLVALVAVAALYIAWRGDASGPLRLDDGELPGILVGEASVHLDDGSVVDLGASARLEALENDGRAFGLLLDAGRTTFDVTPGGPRRWTIECGLATVVVVGTRFTIERSPEQLVVSVERGAVLVRGDRVEGGARRLGPGESIRIEALRTAVADASGPAPSADEPTRSPIDEVHAAAPASPPASVAITTPTARASTWRLAAERGAYDEAYAELGPSGLRREATRASPEELLTLADVARLSGHPAEAIDPLEQILSDHASDPSAGLAAFTLGCVEADSMHRPARAARAFERALDLHLPQALVPDALARLARARAASGDAPGARVAARRYVDEFPDGAQSRSMAALLTGEP